MLFKKISYVCFWYGLFVFIFVSHAHSADFKVMKERVRVQEVQDRSGNDAIVLTEGDFKIVVARGGRITFSRPVLINGYKMPNIFSEVHPDYSDLLDHDHNPKLIEKALPFPVVIARDETGWVIAKNAGVNFLKEKQYLTQSKSLQMSYYPHHGASHRVSSFCFQEGIKIDSDLKITEFTSSLLQNSQEGKTQKEQRGRHREKRKLPRPPGQETEEILCELEIRNIEKAMASAFEGPEESL